jgi:hypothetical protein
MTACLSFTGSKLHFHQTPPSSTLEFFLEQTERLSTTNHYIIYKCGDWDLLETDECHEEVEAKCWEPADSVFCLHKVRCSFRQATFVQFTRAF